MLWLIVPVLMARGIVSCGPDKTAALDHEPALSTSNIKDSQEENRN
jgi:hypothetical protein